MSTHFAYPNVLPKEGLFIGCGRYTVIPPGEAPKNEYREIAETPNTPNRTQLEYALQLLAPDSYDTDRVLVEKQDQSHRGYRGNSLDLAYFLAHTHRSKPFKVNVPGDIWCTGAIEVKDGTPFLHKVDATGFRLKLAHFLYAENRDTVFIVPAANMQKESLETAAAHGVGVISIRQLTDNVSLLETKTKTILKVLPNELSSLVELLFQFNRHRGGRKKWAVAGLVVLVALLAGLWLFGRPGVPSAEEIEKLLQNGDLIAAKQATAQTKENSPLTRNIRALMDSPCDVEMTMVVQKKGSMVPEKFSIKSKEMANLTLSHEDDYRLVIFAIKPPGKRYVYIFQIDESERAYNVFPNVKWKLENPIDADQWPLMIPKGGEEWLFLDQLPMDWKDGMKETLHLLVSPWRAVDIETTFNEIDTETDRNSRKILIEKLREQLTARKEAGIPSLVYDQLSFFHH